VTAPGWVVGPVTPADDPTGLSGDKGGWDDSGAGAESEPEPEAAAAAKAGAGAAELEASGGPCCTFNGSPAGPVVVMVGGGCCMTPPVAAAVPAG